MSSVINFLLLLTLFLTPLIPQMRELGWEQIKVLFFILASSLAGSLYLWDKSNLTNLTNWSGIKILALIFLLTLGITSVLGIDPISSFLGRPPYFQGFIFYAYLFLFFLMVSSVPIKIEKWAESLTYSSFFISFLALKDFILLHVFHQNVENYAGRVISTFGQPNFYAGFLLFTLPFTYLLFKEKDKKLKYFGAVTGLISLAGIFVSYSRSAILLALMLLILGLIDQLKNKVRVGRVILVIVFISITVALVAGSGLVGKEISRPVQTINPDLTRESVEKRVYIWPVALKAAWQKPLTGYGLENIDKAFAGYFEINKHLLFEENLKISPVLISLKELVIDRSHNYPLDLWLFSEIFGLLVWIGLIILLLKKSIQKILDREHNGYILVVSLIVYLIWVQFQNQSIVHLIYFWLVAGLIDQKY